MTFSRDAGLHFGVQWWIGFAALKVAIEDCASSGIFPCHMQYDVRGLWKSDPSNRQVVGSLAESRCWNFEMFVCFFILNDLGMTSPDFLDKIACRESSVHAA